MATNELASETPDVEPGPAELLQRFIENEDERAFEEIVRRHADLVMGVCTRTLGDRHMAEDAFQATFLVLARNAGKVKKLNSLSSWLFGVAYRISLKSRKRMIQILADDAREPIAPDDEPLLQVSRRRDEEILDEELHDLPRNYREVLLLHYLDDLRNADIAEQLSISESAVEGRLKRGRAELRRRLIRRGIGVATFVALLKQGQQAAQACVTPTLIANTVASAVPFSKGVVAHAITTHQLAQEEVLRMLVAAKKWYATWALSCSAAVLSVLAAASILGGQEKGKKSDPFGPGKTEVQVAQKTEPKSVNAQFVTAKGRAAATNAPVAKLKIKAALQSKTQFEFVESPLSEVADYLQQVIDVPVVLDTRALEDVGIGTDSPVTIGIKNISVRSGLKLMLEPLELTYIIRNEVLMLTTRERADELTSTEIYQLGEVDDPEEMIQLIKKMVTPDSWEDVGGPGQIAAVPKHSNLFAIRQTFEIHEEIEEFLHTLNKAKEATKK